MQKLQYMCVLLQLIQQNIEMNKKIISGIKEILFLNKTGILFFLVSGMNIDL